MYDTFFGFSKRPFASAPQVEQYFPGSTIEDARATLVRCLERGEGTAMVVGASGTGKTLLCQVLVEQFRDMFRVALLSNGRLSTRRTLFQAILYELGRAYRGLDEGEARLALADYLSNHEDCPRGMALLVDEAHTLPLRLLDELRMLTNLDRGGEPLVRLVLAGARALEERFTNPRLDSFSQRLVARCYLEPFNRTETQDYIQSGVNAVGGAGEQIFPEPACHSVHQVTDGVGRLINQLCDSVLLAACQRGQHQIDPACVEAAWADLQQLPVPSNSTEEDTCGNNVIEFGGLDDMPLETETADEEPDDDSPEEYGEDLILAGPDTAFQGEFETDEPAAQQPASEAGVSDEPVAEETARPQPLRLSPESECPMTDSPEPAEQLQHVEQLLGDVEEDFQPAGTIGPEAGFVLEQPEYPFNEKFVVEEIIADRYSPLAESTLLQQHRCQEPPKVATTEVDTLSRDILIIEDDYDHVPTPEAIVPVRRQDYRELFTKLRGG